MARRIPSLKKFARTMAMGLLQLVYPKLCWACGNALPQEAGGVCLPCCKVLLKDDFLRCPRCAETVGAYSDLSNGCPKCRKDSPYYSGVVCLGAYDGALAQLVLRMKHSRGEGLAEVIGRLLGERFAAKIRSWQIDAIVPIPLHWWRRLRRGYNQAETLARELSRRLQLPCKPSFLRRVRDTPSQKGNNRQVRIENVKKAFRVSPWANIKSKKILLVDDVLTTGATASEAASTLRKAGAREVYVAVLAHRDVK